MADKIEKIDKPADISEVPVTTEELSLDKLLQSKLNDDALVNHTLPIVEKIGKELGHPLDDFVQGMGVIAIKKLKNIYSAQPAELESFLKGKIYAFYKYDSNNNETVIDNKKTAMLATNENTKLLDAINAAKKSYDELPPDLQTNKEQLTAYKESLQPGAISKIEKQLDGKMDVDDFLRFSCTAKDHQTELQGSEFLKNYKIIYEEREIKDEWFNKPKTMETIARAYEVRDMVQKDEDTSEYINDKTNFPKSERIAYNDIVSDTITQDNLDFIAHFGDKEIQGKLKDYQKDIQGKYTKEFREFVQSSINSINDALNKAKDDAIRTESFVACVCDVADLFDTTTIKKENFSSDLKLSEDAFAVYKNKLTISGSIKNTPITLSHDLTKVGEKLNISTFADENGVFKQTKKSLNIKPYTPSQMAEFAQSILKEPGMTESILESAKNPEEFQALLQKKLSNGLSRRSIDTPFAKHLIESQMETNLAMNEFMYDFLPKGVADNLMNDGEVKKTGKEEVPYAMISKVNLTLGSFTPPEIRQFRTLQKETKDFLERDLPSRVSSSPLNNVLSEAKRDMEEGALGGINRLLAIFSPQSDVSDEKSLLSNISAIDLDDWSGTMKFLKTTKTEKDFEDIPSNVMSKLDQLNAPRDLERDLKDIPDKERSA